MAQYLDVAHEHTVVTPATPTEPVMPTEKPAGTAEPSWLDAEVEVSLATYQAYQVLYYTFIALPLVAGLDKFIHVMGTWELYVSPGLASFLHMSPGAVILLAGVIEVLAAVAVALKPRIGSWVITGWMWLVAVNLIGAAGHRDLLIFNLALSAAGFAFTRLSAECN
jgi:hypothetical protein